jgi:hypothetical protein
VEARYISLSKRITAHTVASNFRRAYIHISFDDVIDIFVDLTRNKETYLSLFDNAVLSYFRDLHELYGAVISCYCYYEDKNKNFDLTMVPDIWKDEFSENSSWLKFGFHTRNESVRYDQAPPEEAADDYNRYIAEMLRITGNSESIDRAPRLHYFAGTLECIEAMKNTHLGLLGVLGADDDRRSYYLDDVRSHYLRTRDSLHDNVNKMTLFSTDFRIEKIDDIDDKLKELEKSRNQPYSNALILFSHEWALNDKIKNYLEKCCDYALANGYVFDFPMNHVDR